MKKIKNKISLLKCSEKINDFEITFMNNIFSFNNNKKNEILTKFKKYERREQIIIMNFFENKNYSIYDAKLNLSNLKSHKKLYIVSKLKFINLEEIKLIESNLKDEHIKIIDNLFSTKLKSLYLSKNKITDMKIFVKENIFINLENLDLSYNSIINLNILIDCNFPNLQKLDLSHNKITDIICLGNDNLNLTKLTILNISYNELKNLNKINIKSLYTLNLLNNNISSGINDFIENFDIYNNIPNELKIEYNDNEIIFNYSNKLNKEFSIRFNYIIEKQNINSFLEKLEFKDIETLEIKGFNNIDFLCNESLDMLKKLDLKENAFNDISIFNKIHFLKIDAIIFNSETIYKGFSSLKVFPSIQVDTIEINMKEQKYIWDITCNIPNITIKIFSDDLNLLKDDIFSNTKKINIPQLILNENLNFFSFNEIKTSFPIFKNLSSKEIRISNKDNKYRYYCKFDSPEINFTFFLDNLSYLSDELFKKTYEISITYSLLNDSIDLSEERLPNLKKIYLKCNTIEDMKIFTEIKNIKKNNVDLSLNSEKNICINNLISCFDETFFVKNEIKIK